MPYATPQAALQAYLDGSRDMDRAKLETCFHPKSILTGFLKGTPVVGTPQIFFDDVTRLVAAGVHNTAYEGKIEAMTVEGSVASASILMSGFAGLNFRDYMHLIEENGRWSIISKLFTTV